MASTVDVTETAERGAADSAPICEAQGVTVAFGTAGAWVAIKDISLSVVSGEVIAILGPSGCGKGTLLRALIRSVAQSSGRV